MSFAAVSHCQDASTFSGIYINGRKVGYSRVFFSTQIAAHDWAGWEPCRDGQVDSVACQMEVATKISVRAYNSNNDVAWQSVAQLQSDFSLERFQFELIGSDSSLKMLGCVSDSTLHVRLGSDPSSYQKISFELSGPIYLAEALPAWLAQNRPAFERSPQQAVTIFEPPQLSLVVWHLEYQGEDRLPDTEEVFFRYKVDCDGLETTLWITEAGAVFKESVDLGPQVTYVAMEEDQQKYTDMNYLHPLMVGAEEQGNDGQQDLLRLTCVQIDQPIKNSSEVTAMVFEMSGVDLPDGMNSVAWQVVEEMVSDGTEKTWSVSITRPVLPQEDCPRSKLIGVNEAAPYLQSEPLLESDHPDIIALADSLTASVSGTMAAVLSIKAWINQHIQSEYRVTVPSALDVLQTGKGDCGEQASLFAALARAAGIPARVVIGLVYNGDAFYYHAWNEVMVCPGEWLPVDPIMNQFPVDATHIRLGEGNVQAQRFLSQLIGKIQIRLRSVRYATGQ